MKKGLIVFVSAAAAAWVVLVSSVVLLLAGVASSASDEFVIGYQRAADLMNGSWQAILAFDTGDWSKPEHWTPQRKSENISD